jgi:hypothetical protein
MPVPTVAAGPPVTRRLFCFAIRTDKTSRLRDAVLKIATLVCAQGVEPGLTIQKSMSRATSFGNLLRPFTAQSDNTFRGSTSFFFSGLHLPPPSAAESIALGKSPAGQRMPVDITWRSFGVYRAEHKILARLAETLLGVQMSTTRGTSPAIPRSPMDPLMSFYGQRATACRIGDLPGTLAFPSA